MTIHVNSDVNKNFIHSFISCTCLSLSSSQWLNFYKLNLCFMKKADDQK